MKPTNLKALSLFFLLFSSLLFSSNLNAKEVELKTIQQVAINFFSLNSGISPTDLKIEEIIPVFNDSAIVYYIINFEKGHIIVSNDDVVEPVLGYGLDSKLDLDNAPSGLMCLLSEYKNEISYIRKKKYKQDKALKQKWEKYSSVEYLPLKSYSPGDYLVKTEWEQRNYYNQYCPEDTITGSHENCPAGCTAVAMAQILRYWGYNKVFPDSASSYFNAPTNSWESVQFWNEEYDWDEMARIVPNDENA